MIRNSAKIGAGARRDPVDTCDIETSSDEYAARFGGPAGAWMLEVQRQAVRALLGNLPPGSTVLDLGGGHAQVTEALLAANLRVVVAGSDPICRARVKPFLSPQCQFHVVDMENLPYPDQSFDATLSIRLLGHAADWQGVVAELCRVASRSTILDYASYRSSNLFAEALFPIKQRAEKGVIRPRSFRVFRGGAIDTALAQNGFAVSAKVRQFLWPMFLHRVLQSPRASSLLEAPGRLTGLTRVVGSPVLIRADRLNA
jgi:hypothetical protein